MVALRAGPPRQRAGRRPRRPAGDPAEVARVQALVDEGRINDKLARQVFDGVLAGEGTPDEVVAARGLEVVSDDGALSAAVDDAIAANPDVADKIRDGKVAAAGALIGAVMKQMRVRPTPAGSASSSSRSSASTGRTRPPAGPGPRFASRGAVGVRSTPRRRASGCRVPGPNLLLEDAGRG